MVIKMKIAVTTQDDKIFQHFGKCPTFTVFTVENNKILNKSLLDSSAHGHSAMADFLKADGVDVIICGGIGDGAKQMLAQRGLELVSGVDGNVEAAVKAYISGALTDMGGGCSHTDNDHEHSCTCGNHDQ